MRRGLAAPCFAFFDSPFYPIAPPAGCVEDVSLGIVCPIPASVTIELGDKLDLVEDWDGPSAIDAGEGADVVRGKGGDDVLLGADGADVLIGGPGNDALDGGAGADTLESYYGGYGVDGGIDPSDTAGSDVLFGGAGNDSVSYEARTDPLTITVDGVADDGAPGENDDIRLDVEVVQGSESDDVMASWSASSRYWVVSSTSVPACTSARMASHSSIRLRGSRPVVGSSSNSSCGAPTRLAPRSRRRRIPPE